MHLITWNSGHLEAGDKKKVVSEEDLLYIEVYPASWVGGKNFDGRNLLLKEKLYQSGSRIPYLLRLN